MKRAVAEAAGYLGVSRVVGLGWRTLLAASLGIADLGFYAMVLAVAALLTVPLDAYYVIRAPRVDGPTFAADRSTRWWAGTVLLVAGFGVIWMQPFAGLVVAKMGADLAFNAVQSGAIRRGRPDEAWRLDALRQIAAAAAATLALVAFEPEIGTLTVVSIIALVPFALIGVRFARVRPIAPVWARRTAIIAAESLASAAYMQGDIVVLGVLAGHGQAGYYSFGVVVVWLAAVVGQQHATVFHQPLRAANGVASAGPTLRSTVVLGLLGTAAMLAFAGATFFIEPRVAWVFLVLAPVAFTRVLSAVFATVLVIGERDRERLVVASVGVVLKLGLVAVFSSAGAVGAAVAFLIADIAITAATGRVVYR